MSAVVSVAIPVRDGARTLPGVLAAVRAQALEREIDLLVCDSGSTDGSREIAREYGARVLEIAPGEFGHGSTRNLLMEHARGEHVALLTQDAEPADERWLERLLAGFARADDVALVYGPYRPRAQADPLTAHELERWFQSLAPDGEPRVDRLEPDERDAPVATLLGRRTFFTDANACVLRAAWSQVPFRAVAYAEDHALSLDMLRAGYAKVFEPQAAVLHSHRYTTLESFRRSFDEWRGLLEVYGWREPAGPRHVTLRLRGELAAERRAQAGAPGARVAAALARATRHHVVRLAGALLGSHADRLPPAVRRWCSLERRASFVPMSFEPRRPES